MTMAHPDDLAIGGSDPDPSTGMPRLEKGKSSPTYIGPDADLYESGNGGHVSLADARRWSLDRLEALEGELQELHEVRTDAASVLGEAKAAHDRAEREHHQKLAEVSAARSDLAWRSGVQR